jgi:N-alpha-acetyltransferase 35, NatC auxiliary subunit
LAVGEVIRAPDFSFLDALGALEIMDPKTDSGLIINDDGANESTDTQHLLPEEIIWIMDQLLAREVGVSKGFVNCRSHGIREIL